MTTTPATFDNPKSRVRSEEPKNRIRAKGSRRPGRRRTTTTTTSTTTEYTLEGNNNLPLEENYPRLPMQPTEGALDRQFIYDSSYETLPHGVESYGMSPSRADNNEENVMKKLFPLFFKPINLYFFFFSILHRILH